MKYSMKLVRIMPGKDAGMNWIRETEKKWGGGFGRKERGGLMKDAKGH